MTSLGSIRHLVAVAVAAIMVGGPLAALAPSDGSDGPAPLAWREPQPAGARQGLGDVAPDGTGPGAGADLGSKFVFWEENLGQWDMGAPWVLRGLPVAITPEALELHGEDHTIRLVLDGANGKAVDIVEARRGTTSVFATDADVTGARHAERLRIADAWPGIHFDVYTTQDGQLEFDFVVAPGADPSQARLRIEGTTPRLEQGRLVLDGFTFQAPRSFQGAAPVESAFRIDGETVHVDVGVYDPGLPLVIDPVLEYGTIVDVTTYSYVYATAATDAGIYFAGYFNSASDYLLTTDRFAVADPYTTYSPFIVHLDPETHDLLGFILLHGEGGSYLYDMDADDAGTIYFTGYTWDELPVQNAPYTRQGTDAIVGKITYDADTGTYDLPFLTFLGSSGTDYGFSINVNPDGSFWVTGRTFAHHDFALAPHGIDYLAGYGPSSSDIFVTRWSSEDVPVHLVTTLYGNRESDYIGRGAMDVDEKGNLYVVGGTYTDASRSYLPTTPDALNPVLIGGSNDHYFGKIAPNGTIEHMSYWGGPDFDDSDAVFVDVVREDEIVIAGSTRARCCVGESGGGMLTEPRPFPDTVSSSRWSYDAYLSHIDLAKSEVLFSTHLGSRSSDEVQGVGYQDGLYYVAGDSLGTQEPDVPHPYDLPKSGKNRYRDAFVTVVDPQRIDPSLLPDDQYNMIAYTMYLGSSRDSDLYTMEFAADGSLQVGGRSEGYPTDVPPVTADALHTVRTESGFDDDGFFQRIDPSSAPPMRAEGGGVVKVSPQNRLTMLAWTDVEVTALLDQAHWPMLPGDVTWDMDADGEFDDATGAGPFLVPGKKSVSQRVCMQAPDPGAFAPPVRRCMTLVWKNQPPTASLVTRPAPDGFVDGLPRYDRGQDIWLDGSDSSDTDGFILYDDATWTLTPAPVILGGERSVVARAVYEDPGIKTVTLHLTDDDGAPATATTTFIVTGTRPALECGLGATRVGRWIDIDVAASDADGYLASWTFAPGSGLENVTGLGAPPPHIRTPQSLTEEGAGTAVLEVVDNDGDTASCEIPYVVGPAGLVADYEAKQVQDKILFTDASLATPGRAVMAWQWSIDGVFVSDEAAFEKALAPGVYRVRITVSDGAATDSYEGLLRVGPPSDGPTARIEVSDGPYVADMPVQFRDASLAGASPVVSRTWTFTDGEAQQAQPIRYMAEGHHEVRLVVTDANGHASETTQHLYVAAPNTLVPSFTISDVTPVAGQEVLFLDESRTEGFGILDREWDFGDGSPVEQGASARHTFDEGRHIVTMTLVGEDGGRHAAQHVVTARAAPVEPTVDAWRPGPPLAAAGPDRVAAPGSIVRLEASGAHQDASWRWEQVAGPRTAILDADTPTPSVAVPYVEGSLAIQLTVASETGTSHDTVQIQIAEAGDAMGVVPAPDARFAVERAGLTVRLEAPGHGLDASYAWDLGDGTTAEGRTVAHTYPDHGAYEVRLLVTDGHGREGFHYEPLDLTVGTGLHQSEVASQPRKVLGATPGTAAAAASMVAIAVLGASFYVWRRRA